MQAVLYSGYKSGRTEVHFSDLGSVSRQSRVNPLQTLPMFHYSPCHTAISDTSKAVEMRPVCSEMCAYEIGLLIVAELQLIVALREILPELYL